MFARIFEFAVIRAAFDYTIVPQSSKAQFVIHEISASCFNKVCIIYYKQRIE